MTPPEMMTLEGGAWRTMGGGLLGKRVETGSVLPDVPTLEVGLRSPMLVAGGPASVSLGGIIGSK